MNKSLIVFKLTEEQRDMMLDCVMFAYEMDIEERNDYDPETCLLYTSPSPRDRTRSRMPSSA